MMLCDTSSFDTLGAKQSNPAPAGNFLVSLCLRFLNLFRFRVLALELPPTFSHPVDSCIHRITASSFDNLVV